MKRILSLIVLLAMVCMLFACNQPDNNGGENNNNAADYKLGIGVVVENTVAANSNTEATVAAVIVDAQGKIVACRLDAIQMKNLFTITKDDAETIVSVSVDETKTFSTKVELGDAYNMVTYGGASAEWYVQAKTFEEYVVGKTAADVAGIATDAEGKTAQIAGCTIIVTGFQEAIAKACADQYAVAFQSTTAPTLGVSVVAALADSSKENDDGTVTVKAEATMDFAAVAMVDGKVVAATLDCAAPTFTYADEANTVKFDGTKRQLGDNYNMVTYGGAIAEWYVQAQTFANTANGKTAAQVAELTIEGVAGCTIYAGSFKAALVKGANNAR